MDIENLVEKRTFKVGDKVIVTRIDPVYPEHGYGSEKTYPLLGWTGMLTRIFSMRMNNLEWCIDWSQKARNDKDFISGDLVYEWMINVCEWDEETNDN